MLGDIVGGRTFSTASPESHICHMCSVWTCSHLWGNQGPNGKGPICGGLVPHGTVVESVRSKLQEGGRFGQKCTHADVLEGFLEGYDWAPSVHTSPGVTRLILSCAGRHCKRSGQPEGSALSDAAGEECGTQPQRTTRGSLSAINTCVLKTQVGPLTCAQ